MMMFTREATERPLRPSTSQAIEEASKDLPASRIPKI